MNPTISSFFEMETGTMHPPVNNLEEKKSQLRVITLKRETLAAEMAYIVRDTIPSYPLWVMDQVNFDDPRLVDIKEKFFDADSKMSKLSWEVDRLQSIHDGELERHDAKVKVYDFLKRMDDTAQINFLQTYSLSTVSLIEAVVICPRLLEDMTDFEENLEIIRANPKVWW